jgi:AcrR family transcriptional regulator
VLTHAIVEPRTARSRRTRAVLLAAARALLEEQGFEGLSMTAVADTAGVTRRTAYLHFTARADLVGALYDYMAEVEGLTDSLQSVWSAADATAALDQWAAHLARYHPRVLAVDRALQRVRGEDADAEAHYARVTAEQLENTRRLAQWLKRENRLAQPWTVASARDMLFALISSDLIGALIEDRNWSRRRLADHLAIVLRSTFVHEPSINRRTESRIGGGTERD